MMNNYAIYEQPLNERIRTFLRLEELFKQTEHALLQTSAWGSRSTMSSLIEILNIFDRIDVKNETSKELERYTVIIERLEKRPAVDELKLKHVLEELTQHLQALQHISGKMGAALREVQLISIVRQRNEIPGGTFNFDIPLYHFWLESPPEQRHLQLKSWLTAFEPIKQAITLLLSLIRNSGPIATETAEHGFFQKGLETANPCQLIRVFLMPNLNVFPEISASKHRISIRFLQSNLIERPTQVRENVIFDLGCCVM